MLLTVPMYINVTMIQECPSGFQLINSGKCECDDILKEFSNNECSIDDHIRRVTRRRYQWIAANFVESDGYVISRHCPYDYCKHETIVVDLNNPNEQCDLDRTGILCGTCPSNLSLAIGSSRCIQCSEYYNILLLIAFAAAGILLVSLIKILDMTIAKGTINGLIFYANIVWANQSVLFFPQAKTSTPLQVLKTFIAWLNLDLDIETCFIPGLDGYWTAWLQFAFPAYIWLIAGLIILASRYSMRATRLFGNNSVPVLATLILLSYATHFGIYFYTKYPSGYSDIVWSYDGNVPYFDLKHSILLALALIMLLVFWLPYTFVLLFIQGLRRQSHRMFLRWVNKFAPFFDTYIGPLKDKHHYWIGLGLLARLVLILTSAVTMTTLPFVSTAVLLVTASVLCLLVCISIGCWVCSKLLS